MDIDKDKEILIKLLEEEIERSNKILYDKFGKEFIDNLHKMIDKELETALEKQFDNFAEVISSCRSCHNKADRRLVHKQTKEKYPFCQKCIDKGFYNKEIFDIEE